jgi:hypothetical protein
MEMDTGPAPKALRRMNGQPGPQGTPWYQDSTGQFYAIYMYFSLTCIYLNETNFYRLFIITVD